MEVISERPGGGKRGNSGALEGGFGSFSRDLPPGIFLLLSFLARTNSIAYDHVLCAY